VVIGQAAEFDYAGTQACRALREEGVRTILINSNPATIMTDPTVADVIYLEPLTVEAVEAVIAKEQPEGLLAGLGGQTALNLTAAMADAGVFDRHPIRLLGTPLEAIRMAEDREAFRDLLDRIGQPYAPSFIVEGATQAARDSSADEALETIGLPAIVRPAFTLGGTGGGIVETEPAYRERVRAGLRASPIGQVMVERCLVGWQEIEYEVMRDADDTCIAVCGMENVDPLGVHTGDSIVVAPVQTLTDAVHQRLRSAALAIIRALGVEGGCNVQFALSPDSTDYAVIEVNPRVSRSSALASKATGYPIARVAAQIAIGRRLAEIPNVVTGTTVAAFEPALDYVVVKLPRFPFDKFPGADRTLGSQMKATGEVMAIDRTFGSALNKALRGLEQAGVGPLAEDDGWRPALDYLAGVYGGDPEADEPIRWVDEAGRACESTRHAQRTAAPIVLKQFLEPSDSRLWRILGLLRRGVPEAVIRGTTGIAAWFLAEMGRNVALGPRSRGRRLTDTRTRQRELLAWSKRAGFGDRELAGWRADPGIGPRMTLRLDPATRWSTRAAGSRLNPYFYSTCARPVRFRRHRRAQGGAGHRLRPGPVGQGIDSTTARSGRGHPAGRVAAVMMLQPGDRLDRLRRLVAAVPTLDPETSLVIDAESPGGSPPAGLVAAAARRPQSRGPRAAAAGSRARPRGHRPGRGAGRFSACWTASDTQPEGGMAHS
jgi:carbamoyl-phosphate synthase large subunit